MRVLIVEDDPLLADGLRGMLRREGYVADCVGSGESAEASLATARPDLVIHVGDYHYREDACPAGHAGCAGSPFGYGFDAWNADFFGPAAPLLAAAPWVMVRGNHEDCSRAGEGWFRFLDRAPMEPTCRDFTGDFVAKLGDFGIVVVDGANGAGANGQLLHVHARSRVEHGAFFGHGDHSQCPAPP